MSTNNLRKTAGASMASQPINDENSNRYKTSKDLLTEQQPQKNRQQNTRLTGAQIKPARRVLGVISDSSLNTKPATGSNGADWSGKLKSKAITSVTTRLQKAVEEDEEMAFQEPQSHIEKEQQLDDEDEEDVDEDFNTSGMANEPMSPIINETIVQEINRAYMKYSRDYLDPEDEDTFDVSMVAEYGNQIFNYLHELEYKFAPNPRYVEEVQNELTWDHRATLMNWLVQLHSRFNLLPETLFLTVNIIDRFLSLKTISLSRFQLCGAVALFIAAKYEEINVPTVSQMIYMVGDQFTVPEFLRAEKFMIEVLKFELGWPGPMSFLRRGSKADDYDNEVRTVAKYFVEVTLMNPKFVASAPSWLAAGAQYLARRMLGRGDWTQAHVFYTGYTAAQLEPLAELLEECCLKASTNHQAIFEKYSERKFKRSAIYVHDYLNALYNESS